jgi:hypothetical protein
MSPVAVIRLIKSRSEVEMLKESLKGNIQERHLCHDKIILRCFFTEVQNTKTEIKINPE